jgi:PIN domain nuclease of toxin-antitoxin system
VILLLDTHLLLWAAGEPDRLPPAAKTRIEATETRLLFSAASLWEVTIKAGLGRADFVVEPRLLRRGLLENGYEELPVRSIHVVAVGELPSLHRDPFDRLLVAQAQIESVTLMTADEAVAAYPGPILKV